jgi:hypothetical protein
MKIWVKLYKNEKIYNSLTFKMTTPLNRQNYEKDLHSICEELDLSTPITLSSHFSHFLNFNISKYLPRDFIEQIDFDFMTLEAF